jgi:hypothetical protein
MNKLLQILRTIPVNVCGCERSFSSLRRIKTYIRNTTGQERLTINLINLFSDAFVEKWNLDQQSLGNPQRLMNP